MRKIFVTGIGTDVGKTIVCAVLVEALMADYWKPIQCGVTPSTDSELVKSLLTNSQTKIHPEAYCLKEPKSPHSAAKAEGVSIDLEKVKVPKSDNINMIIEGAGGLMVPLNEKNLVVDLISHLKAEVIIVSSFYLGSINHTLLTCSELKARHIPVLGIIFNGDYVAESADIILKQSNLKMLGKIAQETKFEKNTVLRYTSQFAEIL